MHGMVRPDKAALPSRMKVPSEQNPGNSVAGSTAWKKFDAASGTSKAFDKEGSKEAGRNVSERYSFVTLSAER
jgi:hypothetical protein